MLLKVSCNANWAVCCPSVALSSVLTFIYWQSHFRPASSMPVGFCLSSLARRTHPICQALLVMSLNECGRHKASSVETEFPSGAYVCNFGSCRKVPNVPGTCAWWQESLSPIAERSGISRNCLPPKMLWP